MKEKFLGRVKHPSCEFLYIVYKNNITLPLLRYKVYLDVYDEPGFQIILDYINENNLGTYSHCEFMTSEVVLIYFDNVNPKLLLELI
jgi:hypothetical protein